MKIDSSHCEMVAESLMLFVVYTRYGNFVCLVGLRFYALAIVMPRRSVRLNTLVFLSKLDCAINQDFMYILSLVTGNSTSWISGRSRITL